MSETESNTVEMETEEKKDSSELGSSSQKEVNTKEEKDKIKILVSDYDEDEYKRMLSLYEKTFNVIKENELVKGKIVAVNGEDVLIDIGSKSDGRVSVNEFADPEEIKVGNEIEVFLEKIEDKEGQLVLSKKKADSMKMWDNVVDAQKNGTVIRGKCIRRIKGGFVVDIKGLSAFLPGSQIDTKPIRDYDEYVGKMMDFKILKVNNQNENIIISHKVLIEESMAGQREELLKTIQKGMTMKAVVKAITDFGVFVDLGGLDGLVHITDLSWGRINHPNDVVKLDQEIEVFVLEFDPEKQRVYLGLKQLQKHPWDDVKDKYKIGNKVTGKVVSLTEYGAFIEIEKGVEGLIHVSEMSWTQHITNPTQMVSMGQVVEAQILTIDSENKKLSLGMKQLTPNPWQSLLDKFPVGTKHKGKVCNVTNFGLFIELEEGVDGLVHISDLSWTKKILDISEYVKIGDEFEVVILGVDVANQRISLGRKQLLDNPWDKLEDKYKVGTEAEAKIIKPIEKGIIVELPNDVDSFIPASQLSTVPIKNFSELFKTGETLKAEVIEFDKNNKKVVLSVIEYLKDKEQPEIDEYINKFKIPKKFSTKDIQEKTRSFESEQIDFKIEDIIGEDVPEMNHPPVIENPMENSKPPAVETVKSNTAENEKKKEPAKEDKTDKSKTDVKSEQPKAEVKAEQPTKEDKTDKLKIEVKSEETKAKVKAEEPKKENKADKQKSDVKSEETKEEVKAEEQKVEDKTDKLKIEVKSEETKAKVKAEEPKKENKADKQKSDVKSEETKEEVKAEEQKVEEKTDKPKAEVKSEEPKAEEPKAEENKI